MQAYCVKCKTSRDIKDEVKATLKNGRPVVKGTCPVCGTNLNRMVKADQA
jgi:uncharacterized Zn finger protein (UPF0148 family)